MSDLINQYRKHYDNAQVVNIDWLNQLRQNAWNVFAELGFPSKRDEDWKYTNITPIVQQKFNLNTAKKIFKPSQSLDDVWQIDIMHGTVSDLTRIQQLLPTGVIVESLHQALVNHTKLVKPYLASIVKVIDNGFTALNTALMSTGIFIYVPQEVVLDKPIKLVHHGVDGSSQHIRHCIVAEACSELFLIEEFKGEGSYFTNSMTEIIAKDNSTVSHFKLQTETLEAYHIGSVHGLIHAGATINSHSFSFGGALVRSDTNVEFVGKGGYCLMNGLYCVEEKQHVDHHTKAIHSVPECNSDEFYKGILSGQSRAVFNGKVVVAKNAQKTNASQQNKNLLLSKNVEVDTKPQLEIFADDVKCAHGATVGQLDDEALFYLRTRGLNTLQAKGLLIQAFVADRIESVPLESLRNQLLDCVRDKRMVD